MPTKPDNSEKASNAPRTNKPDEKISDLPISEKNEKDSHVKGGWGKKRAE